MSTKLEQARRAIERMLDYLDSRDEVFLESFSSQAQLMERFTTDHLRIKNRLRYLRPTKETALYDAILLGLYEMRHAQRDKRALLVVTDGLDTASITSRREVIAAARKIKVLIYTIGIGDEGISRDGKPFGGIFEPDENQVDMRTLKDLSEETGAKAFNLKRVGDGEELSRDCETISNELPRQYTLAYLSPDPGRPGYRSLRIDVPKHPELKVRVRKGVEVRSP